MDITYKPYTHPEFQGLIERIHPPRVCVDNDSCTDCTLVKVDSANKHGILLEMVQVLTDLDLVISKSYVSSDGGWLMDVFHVTDQLGHKLTNTSLIDYIQEGICKSRQAWKDENKVGMGQAIQPHHVSTEHLVLEMTGVDRPGLMSEMSAVLAELACHVTTAVAWTHNGRAACIIYVEAQDLGPARVAQVQAQLEIVVEAHHQGDERRSVRLAAGRTHDERRLHQLLAADSDYEACRSCCGGNSEDDDFYVYGGCHRGQKKGCDGTHVRIENCKVKGYSIINIRSRDRAKLLFDTLCVLMDLQYVVYHAAISSHRSTAFQEYYVRHKDGRIMSSECEKYLVTKSLIAATERRVSHGLRLGICTKNRAGLLSDVTRAFRENGLSIKRAEIGVHGDEAVGSFYVEDTTGELVNIETLEVIRREIGGDIMFENKSAGTTPEVLSTRMSMSSSSSISSNGIEERPRFSLGNLLWSQLERLSSNFRPIKS